MAQTTGALSMKGNVVECGTDGSTWTDYSGQSNEVAVGDGQRQIGEAYTFDGDTAIIKGGKRKPLKITVKGLYTEGTELFEASRAAYEAGTAWYVRYAPKGTGTGNFRFTSAEGIIEEFYYPGGVAEDGKPIPAGFVVVVPSLTKAVQA